MLPQPANYANPEPKKQPKQPEQNLRMQKINSNASYGLYPKVSKYENSRNALCRDNLNFHQKICPPKAIC